MRFYKLNELASKPRGTRVLLPEIHESLAQEAQYLKVLRSMLRQLAKQVREDVMPAYAADLASKKLARRMITDVDADIWARLRQFGDLLARVATGMVGNILGLSAKKHTKNFVSTAKKALGIDLSAIVREEDLQGLLDAASIRNASLIKGLSDATIARVSNSVMAAVMAGTPAKDLRLTLAKDFGFSDSRAKVIARDQISKLNADMNRFRHQQAGVNKYTWRTSADERVRPRHRALEGKVYAYGEATGAEDGLPPGQPILCRCVAQAIVEF